MVEIELRKFHYIEIEPGEYTLNFLLKERVKENGFDSTRIRVRGFLKWDGCMNWSTLDGFMYHFCDEDDADLLNECFRAVWAAGPEHIEKWMD
jgi:hypothetical protein